MARRTTTRRRSTTRRSPVRKRTYAAPRRRASTRRASPRAQTIKLVIEAAAPSLATAMGADATREVLSARETAPKKAKL